MVLVLLTLEELVCDKEGTNDDHTVHTDLTVQLNTDSRPDTVLHVLCILPTKCAQGFRTTVTTNNDHFNNIYTLQSSIKVFYVFSNATCFGPIHGPSSVIQIHNQIISVYITEYDLL